MMPTGPAGQILLMGMETVAVSCLFLLLFRFRKIIGLSPLFITIGVFQHMQVMLVVGVYVELAPNLAVSPGSVVLFTGSIFVVFLVYIREDANEARKLIYGLLASNFILGSMGLLFSLHLKYGSVINFYNIPQAFFFQDARILAFGSLALFLDSILIIYLFEAISRLTVNWLFLRIWITMSIVLIFDTALFLGLSFPTDPNLKNLLISGMIGKLAAGLLYSIIFTIFLKFFDTKNLDQMRHPSRLKDVFQLLTYRQKFDVLQAAIIRDALTGVYNRGYFDEILKNELERAARENKRVTLLMIDIDHFKKINDSYGHQQGDEALRLVASKLAAASREYDTVCRYGGEEFGIVLPSASLDEGILLAKRIKNALLDPTARIIQPEQKINLTVTIGIASFPADGKTVEQLIKTSDHRLLEGKRLGRDRIVSSDAAIA